MDAVSKMVNFISELREIAEEVEGTFYVDVDHYGEMGVHIGSGNVFFELFDTFDVIVRDSEEIPYKVVTDVEGIKFYAVLNEKEYNKYVKKTA